MLHVCFCLRRSATGHGRCQLKYTDANQFTERCCIRLTLPVLVAAMSTTTQAVCMFLVCLTLFIRDEQSSVRAAKDDYKSTTDCKHECDTYNVQHRIAQYFM